MVRFIIGITDGVFGDPKQFTFHYGQIYYLKKKNSMIQFVQIYIPLWLDLLFILKNFFKIIIMIYIPLWLDLLCKFEQIEHKLICHLHSTMVRFIIIKFSIRIVKFSKFTFHYGQIYYSRNCCINKFTIIIYIPLWLDLL